MGLYERWTTSDDPDQPLGKLNVHAFGAALAELARGSVTEQQVASAFGLSTDDQTELAAIIEKYNNLPNSTAKAAAMSKFHDVMILVEAGFYNKTKAKTELGF